MSDHDHTGGDSGHPELMRVIAEDIKVGDRVAPRRDSVFREVAEIRVHANVHMIYTDGCEDIIPKHALWWREWGS